MLTNVARSASTLVKLPGAVTQLVPSRKVMELFWGVVQFLVLGLKVRLLGQSLQVLLCTLQ